MTRLNIPKSYVQERPGVQAVLRAILGHDQYDDWLPDPVFYADQEVYLSEAADKIESLLKNGSVKTDGAFAFTLPRADEGTLSALYLPLSLRAVSHIVIGALADRIERALLRDKVYGFRRMNTELALFSAPGQELDHAITAAFNGAMVDDGNRMLVLDVRAFNRSASPDRLVELLAKANGMHDETSFLKRIIRLSASGLPSIDDAFALVYNLYLSPVDQALFERKLNFVRYRDEFLVFSASSAAQVKSSLGAMSLGAEQHDLGLVSELSSVPLSDDSTPTEQIGELLDEPLIARYSCQSTDSCELDAIALQRNGEFALQKMFKLPIKAPLDAVKILPMLRDANRRRAKGSWLSFAEAASRSREFADYQRELAAHRPWIKNALAVGVSKAEWQVIWASTLLADAGPLEKDDIALLSSVVAAKQRSQPVRNAALLALARSAPGSEVVWPAATNGLYSWSVRSRLAAASCLRRKGGETIWNRESRKALRAEPSLVAFLEQQHASLSP